MIIPQLPVARILLPGKQSTTPLEAYVPEKMMKKELLLSLLILMFCYPEGTKASGSLGLWDGIDWITDISIDYLQGYAWKCGQHAVRRAIYHGCEDLEIASCRRAAEKVRDSHSNSDFTQYVCESLGSWIYKAGKELAVRVVQATSYGLSFLGWLISIPLSFIGYAFGSARYLLN